MSFGYRTRQGFPPLCVAHVVTRRPLLLLKPLCVFWFSAYLALRPRFFHLRFHRRRRRRRLLPLRMFLDEYMMEVRVAPPISKPSTPSIILTASFLCFVQFALASATQVAIIHIQLSSATPSRDRRLFRTAFNGTLLYGPPKYGRRTTSAINASPTSTSAFRFIWRARSSCSI